jgi:hypothetical protein
MKKCLFKILYELLIFTVFFFSFLSGFKENSSIENDEVPVEVEVAEGHNLT